MSRPLKYLCLKDEDYNEVVGSRREVDFDADRAGYIDARRELEQSAPGGCWVFDSEG